MYIQPDIYTYENGGNGNSYEIPVCMPRPGLTYPTSDDFLTDFQNAFITAVYTTPINTQNPMSKTIVSRSSVYYQDHIDISLNLNCYYYLGEQNYDVSFNDASFNITDSRNIWNQFNIYPVNDLSTNIVAGYADITGYKKVDPNITTQITLYDNTNNSIRFYTNNPSAPSETITIDISSGTYTTIPLYTAINNALSKNPRIMYIQHKIIFWIFMTLSISSVVMWEQQVSRIRLGILRLAGCLDFAIILNTFLLLQIKPI